MENKLLIISHIGDNDGVTPIILANLTFKNFDKKLIEVKEVDETVKENIENFPVNIFPEIITDDKTHNPSYK